MHDRAFVRGDRVSAMLQRRFQVFDGRLAGLEVERTGFEEYIGARILEPFADVARGCACCGAGQ